MAKSKIPGALERRHLVEGELPVDQGLQIAEAYLAEGRCVEAVDFLEKAGATDAIEALRRQAIEAGDAFLLRMVAVAEDRQPAQDEWRILADAAAAAGKDRYAAEARRQAERGED